MNSLLEAFERDKIRKELTEIREDMLEESKNGMKQIAKDWYWIKKQYLVYRHSYDVQEAFNCSLRDCGYLKNE